LNSFREYLSTSIVDFSTVRPVVPLSKSHLNAAALFSKEEGWAIEALEDFDFVDYFSPNDRRLLTIPYEYLEVRHDYVPDFLVRLQGGRTVLLEIKGYGGELHHEDAVLAKNAAAQKWVAALNNYGRFGLWAFEICRAKTGESQATFTRNLRAVLEKHAAAPVSRPFRIVESPSPADRWKTCVPVISLRAAAGGFSEEQAQGEVPLADDTEWVTFETSHRFTKGMFVAQVRGKSMEPKIRDGAWCLFRPPPHGSRNGRILLVASHEIRDPEHPGRYTLKVFESEKASSDDSWMHIRITLKPINRAFEPIVLTPEVEGAVRPVAEFVEVIEDRS
jgi:SOS-response transcriptional repressor LexA